MKKFLKWALVLPLIASISITGCNKDEDDDPTPTTKSPVEGKELLFESSSVDADIDVKVYADQALTVGYNKLYVMVYKLGTKTVIDDAHVSFETDMEMLSGMNHGSPVESPEETNPEDGVFEGAAVFVMPSAGNGTWNLHVHVHNHSNSMEGEVSGVVTVTSPTEARMYSFLSDVDGAMVFVSLIEPMNPEVGENTFEVAIHQRESMMSWPFMEGLTVEIEPEMPTMGHGSPGNVNPVYTEMGHYVGKVNYTMTGLWRVHVTVKDGDGNIMNDNMYFDMTF